MAVNLYHPFVNPIAGESFRCIAYTPDAYVMEWIVQPRGYVPFEHIHLNQDEIFHVKSGEIRLVIEGKTHIGKPGERIVVPKGARHIAYNNSPAVLTCIVEYTPGLDHYRFFQCFGGLTIDRDIDAKGSINIPKMLYFTRRMNAQALTRPTSVPAPLFGLMINLCGAVGTLLGWHRDYQRYTEGEPLLVDNTVTV